MDNKMNNTLCRTPTPMDLDSEGRGVSWANRLWFSVAERLMQFVAKAKNNPSDVLFDPKGLVNCLFSSLLSDPSNGFSNPSMMFNGEFGLKCMEIMRVDSFIPNCRWFVQIPCECKDLTNEEHAFAEEYSKLVENDLNIGPNGIAAVCKTLTATPAFKFDHFDTACSNINFPFVISDLFDLAEGYDIGDVLVFLNDLAELMRNFSKGTMEFLKNLDMSSFNAFADMFLELDAHIGCAERYFNFSESQEDEE